MKNVSVAAVYDDKNVTPGRCPGDQPANPPNGDDIENPTGPGTEDEVEATPVAEAQRPAGEDPAAEPGIEDDDEWAGGGFWSFMFSFDQWINI